VHNKPVEQSETQVLELLSWALHAYIGSACVLVPDYCEFVLTATFTSRVFVARPSGIWMRRFLWQRRP